MLRRDEDGGEDQDGDDLHLIKLDRLDPVLWNRVVLVLVDV
jgi:hypothetical protein